MSNRKILFTGLLSMGVKGVSYARRLRKLVVVNSLAMLVAMPSVYVSAPAYASSSVSGVVNTYASVNAISGDAVSVGNIRGASDPFNAFSVGDKVLLIQMTGDPAVRPGSTMGVYEERTVTSVGAGGITLDGIQNSYDTATEAVQLVKIYDDTGTTTVAGDVTPLPWDGETGGVVAMCGDDLVLNANINATGTGFTQENPPGGTALNQAGLGQGSEEGRGHDSAEFDNSHWWTGTPGGGGLGGGGYPEGVSISASDPSSAGPFSVSGGNPGQGGVHGGNTEPCSFLTNYENCAHVPDVVAPGVDGGNGTTDDTLTSGKGIGGGGGGGIIGGGGSADTTYTLYWGGAGGGVAGGGTALEMRNTNNRRFVQSGSGGGSGGVGNGGNSLPMSDGYTTIGMQGTGGAGGGSYGGGGGAASEQRIDGGGGGSYTGGGAASKDNYTYKQDRIAGSGNDKVAAPIPDSLHYLNHSQPRLMMGGAGGKGAAYQGGVGGTYSTLPGSGTGLIDEGAGGGIIYLCDYQSITGVGDVISDGEDGKTPLLTKRVTNAGEVHMRDSGSGGGAGGQIYIQTASLGVDVSAAGGDGGSVPVEHQNPSTSVATVGQGGAGGGGGGIWLDMPDAIEAAGDESDVNVSGASFDVGGGVSGNRGWSTNSKTLDWFSTGGDGGTGLISLTAQESLSLGGYLWNDADNDGVQDAGEAPIAGSSVMLLMDDGNGNFVPATDVNGTLIASQIVGADGLYYFDNLVPGTYKVLTTPPAGYTASPSQTTVDDNDVEYDSNIAGETTVGTFESTAITLAPNSEPVESGALPGDGLDDADDSNGNMTLDMGFTDLGSVSGTVLTDTTGNGVGDTGVEGVTVELWSEDGSTLIDSVVTDASGNYTFENVQPGNYIVREVDADGYSSLKDGDTTNPGNNPTNTDTNDNQVPVTVTVGEIEDGIVFEDVALGSVSGSVMEDTNDDGVGDQGIANVTLELYKDDDNDGVPDSTTPVNTVQTDSLGNYTFEDVLPGSYVVKEIDPANTDSVQDLDTTNSTDDAPANSNTNDNLIPADLLPGEDETGNNFIDEASRGSVSGSVMADTNGDTVGDEPLSEVTIELYPDTNGSGTPDAGSSPVKTTTTDSNGAYTFTDVAPGQYVIVETDPSDVNSVWDGDTTSGGDDVPANTNSNDNMIPVTLTTGESDTGNNFVDRSNQGTVSGSVKEDTDGDSVGDSGVSNVIILLYPDSDNDGAPDSGSLPVATGVTDANGDYELNNVPVGSYVVVETDPTGYTSFDDGDSTDPSDDSPSNLDGTDNMIPVDVEAGETDDGNEFVDYQPATVSGTVTDENGDPVPNATVKLYPDADNNGAPDVGSTPVGEAVTDSAGNYSIGDLPPGSYVAEMIAPSGYETTGDEDITNPGDDSPGNINQTDGLLPVDLVSGETDDGNNFAAGVLTGTISGTVSEDLGGSNAGVADALMLLFTDNDNDGQPDSTVSLASTRTDGNGEYSFTDVDPGSYVVRQVLPADKNAQSDGDTTDGSDDTPGNASQTDSLLPVDVIEGESDTGNDFMIYENGEVSGSVLNDDDGNGSGDTPLSGVTVELYEDADGDGVPDSTTPLATTQTDTMGQYAFPNTEPGNYVVKEIDPDGKQSVSDSAAPNDNLVPVEVLPSSNVTADFVDEDVPVTTGDISGTVAADHNGDGEGDTPAAGVSVALYADNDNDGSPDSTTPLATIMSHEDGTYTFVGVEEGSYVVVINDGTEVLKDGDTTDAADDSPSNIATADGIIPVDITGGETDDGNDFVVDNDTDGDQIPDSVDLDDDNDGIPDVTEGTGDADSDGIPDHLDLDSDNDGIPDIIEAGGVDENGDGLIDNLNPDGTLIDDFNGNGLSDLVDPSEGGQPLDFPDFDGDNLPDAQDIDADDDGIVDLIESQPTLVADGYNEPVGVDTDGDGIDDAFDVDCNTSTACGGVIGDPFKPIDTDMDGQLDYEDLDSDNDEEPDLVEGNDYNGDGVPDVTPTGNDSDGDGLDDAFDVDGTSPTDNGGALNDDDPITLPNTDGGATERDYREGPDTDGDNIVDALDDDADNDGIPNAEEGAGGDPYADDDGDGVPNYYDENYCAPGGLVDGICPEFDVDGDDIPDFLDLDSDNDGITDIIEAGGTDADQDGEVDYPTPGDPTSMVDVDEDGIDDNLDLSEGGTPLTVPNTDGTGGDDPYDIDADNDGLVDVIEAQPTDSYVAPTGQDDDGDGIDNAYDVDCTAANLCADNTGLTFDVIGTPITPENTDGADAPDYQDLDSDNDGETDPVEGHDYNGDGTPETTPTGNDSDGDGLDDAYDVDGTSPVDSGGADNGGETPNTKPNTDGGDLERDWRDPAPTETDTDGDQVPDVTDLDDDNDGILDIDEGTGDTDGDLIPDSLDLDSDNDTIPDNVESQPTDSYVAPTGVDSDGDGVDDAYDPDCTGANCGGVTGAPVSNPDSDGDSTPDVDDLDSDGDNINDIDEVGNGANDTDNDGETDQPVGINGLDNTEEPADTYADVNGDIDDPTTLPNLQKPGTPEVDYREKPDVAPMDADVSIVKEATPLDPALGANVNYVLTVTNLGDATATNVVINDDFPAGLTLVSWPLGYNTTTGELTLSSLAVGTANEVELLFIAETTQTGTITNTASVSADESDPDTANNTDDVAVVVGNDTDGDNINDDVDLDDDNDGIPDVVELATAPASGDTDGDNIPDDKDLDADGDGIPDSVEAGHGQDTDGDGVIDDETGCDVGANGLAACVESNDTQNPTLTYPITNTDGDTLPDFQDLDSENDGVPDATEGHDADHDGVPDTTPSGSDTDGDGLDDAFDPDCATATDCGGVIGVTAPLPNTDSPADDLPDYRDTDDDNDGVLTDGTTNVDGQEGTGDENNDGIPDYLDPAATDADLSIVKDATPLDPVLGANVTYTLTVTNLGAATATNVVINDDFPAGLTLLSWPIGYNTSTGELTLSSLDVGTVNQVELTFVAATTQTGTITNTATVSADEADPDTTNNTSSKSVVVGNDTDGDQISDDVDLDDDNDGIPDTLEQSTATNGGDSDGDNIPDEKDLDADGDGIPDSVEAGHGQDADGDGLIDCDVGTNGLGDCVEAGTPDQTVVTLTYTPLDSDGQGTPDYQDTDSENDGVPDSTEGHDANHDGVPDTTPSGSDTDGDGLDDAFDPDCATATDCGGVIGVTAPLPNTDSPADDLPDYRDTDDDNDGVSTNGTTNVDGQEGTGDEDNDGRPDYLDAVVNTGSAILNLKVFLRGAMEGSEDPNNEVVLTAPTQDALMRDDLRHKGIIPTSEPYSAMPEYVHVGGGGETAGSWLLTDRGEHSAVDWVFVELRSAADNAVVLESQSAIVLRNGDIVDAADGVSPLTMMSAAGDYYISVNHRNHLGVMTGSSVAVSDTTTIDFTRMGTSQTWTRPGFSAQPDAQYELGTARDGAVNINVDYGLGNGRYAMWLGDGRIDSMVIYAGGITDTAECLTEVINDGSNILESRTYVMRNKYTQCDYNLDGIANYAGATTDIANFLHAQNTNHPKNPEGLLSLTVIEHLPD